MDIKKDFIPINQNYDNLKAYQKNECIYDVTFYFAHHYLESSDRTIDQMVQAARSGKQNIAEGIEAGTTSKETAIKLVNVARASLQELLVDYKDYLRVREQEQWQPGSAKYEQCRKACYKHNDSAYYRDAIKLRNDTAIANISITLIFQTDKLLKGLIEHLKENFIQTGGIREEMTRSRLKYRDEQR
jgi:four helix bundle suffix protein